MLARCRARRSGPWVRSGEEIGSDEFDYLLAWMARTPARASTLIADGEAPNAHGSHRLGPRVMSAQKIVLKFAKTDDWRRQTTTRVGSCVGNLVRNARIEAKLATKRDQPIGSISSPCTRKKEYVAPNYADQATELWVADVTCISYHPLSITITRVRVRY